MEFEGNAVEEINAHAFERCENLTQIVLPDSVSKISEYAFYECKALETVKLPKSLNQIEAYAYANSGLKDLSIDPETELSTYDTSSFAQTDHSVIVKIGKNSWADKNFDDVFSGAFERSYN